MMSVSTNFGEIWEAWIRLRQLWQRIKGLWLDKVQRDFEREFWQPLETFMPQFKDHTEKLNKVIQDARRNVH